MANIAKDLAFPVTTFLAPIDNNNYFKIRFFSYNGSEFILCGSSFFNSSVSLAVPFILFFISPLVWGMLLAPYNVSG